MKLIAEAIGAKNFTAAQNLILKYLKNKQGLGAKVYPYPTPEVFTPVGGPKQIGIRYFINDGGYKSIRLNWKQVGKIGSQGLASIDFWDGSKNPQPTPQHHIKLNSEQSLVKVLPLVADLIAGKLSPGAGVFLQESVGVQFTPMITDFSAVSEINEASYSTGDLTKTIHNVLGALKQGVSPGDQYRIGGTKKYGPGWSKVIDYIKASHPKLLEKQGAKWLVNQDEAAKIKLAEVLAAISDDPDATPYEVVPGSKEEVEVEGASEEDVERLTYEEQLDSLKTAMKLLMSNATQALFISGRGGTGKTQNVEDELHAAGKTDGDGYVKITGTASTAGIYRILFQHRKEILLFDDSDGAFLDQDSRNLFKAASDTKKVRKIAWQKGGKNYVDADDYDWDNEGDQEELPRSFEFTGKIIGISNLQLNKLDPDGALRTRGYIINIDPTNAEIYAFLRKIAMKIPLDVDYTLNQQEREDIIDILEKRRIPEKTANIRSFVRSLNTRAGVEKSGGSADEWKKFVLRFC